VSSCKSAAAVDGALTEIDLIAVRPEVAFSLTRDDVIEAMFYINNAQSQPWHWPQDAPR
jgi:hypothetical protein